MLNFSANNNLEVNDTSGTTYSGEIGKSTGFQKADSDALNNAFEFAKQYTKDNGIEETDPQYYQNLSNITKSLTGMEGTQGLPKDALGLQMPGADNTQPFELMKTNNINATVPATVNATQNAVANPQKIQTVVESLKVRETQDSSAFIGTVPESATVWKTGQTGPELNGEAKKRLDLMKKHGFGTSF